MIVLEALNALYGDCLLLRYEDVRGQSRTWLVDGGPRGTQVAGKTVSVWKDVLLPRLRQIDAARPILIDVGMVSHIDDDHINGIERLTAELVAAQPHPGEVKFRRFWFNAFDELVGPVSGQSSGSIALQLSNPNTSPLGAQALGDDGDAVAQSIPQGNKLAANLRSLGLQGNQPLNGLLAANSGDAALLIDGARITIVGPLKKRLDRLREDWRKAMSMTTGKARAAALAGLFATKLDSSVPNLSSIVVLVEIDGTRMLLTGDARGDDIVTAWAELGLPQSARRLDVLKIPHHGSSANNPESFIRFFEASHYVFSADGHHDNPDPPVLEGLVSIHGHRPITLHFTNADIVWKKAYRLDRGGAEVKTLAQMLAALRTAYPGPWTTQARADGEHSVIVSVRQ